MSGLARPGIGLLATCCSLKKITARSHYQPGREVCPVQQTLDDAPLHSSSAIRVGGM